MPALHKPKLFQGAYGDEANASVSPKSAKQSCSGKAAKSGNYASRATAGPTRRPPQGLPHPKWQQSGSSTGPKGPTDQKGRPVGELRL